ncbi:MAG: 50S ribosomal protein L7/L12 [Candidatus Peregrinibacteria bacterium]|nr:50S ribosomal protein L7/L12 [Candidatus Peregrinibacteria bacterium]MDZ4244660.1 50S ribosomal protein L7/L12 [Candidatus Gracilibacteria bacterium]
MSEGTKEAVKLSKEEQAVIDAVEKLNIVQLNNVVKFMEEEYGISAAAPVAMAAPAGGASAGGDDEVAKSAFNVVLKDGGASKIAVIKVVKEITGLGLKEAKDIVDGAPKAVKENVPTAEAEKMKADLEAAGATVELA